MGALLMAIDPALAFFDLFAAKQMSARASRAGAIYYPDNVRTCATDVQAALGEPQFIRAEWSSSVDGLCPADIYYQPVSGTPIKVTVHVTYHPFFWSGVWEFDGWTEDAAR
jgi:hypothetical protein